MTDSSLPSFGDTAPAPAGNATPHVGEPAQTRCSIERTASGKLNYKITVGVDDDSALIERMRRITTDHFLALEKELREYETQPKEG